MPPKAKAKAGVLCRPAAHGRIRRRPATVRDLAPEAHAGRQARTFAEVGPQELLKLGAIWMEEGTQD